MPTKRDCRSSAISRSSWRTIRRMSGRTPTCSTWTGTASRPSWRASRRIISRRPASCGAIRSTSWDVHKASGYAWWLERIRATLKLVDILRIDHFRGFAGYWEIPAGNPTAEIGRWVPGPGADFFKTVQANLGSLPILAEDLGVITPDVVALRDQFGLPGMKILQFAFSGPDNPFLPHSYPQNCVVYTGTHDNDTTRGWYAACAGSGEGFRPPLPAGGWQPDCLGPDPGGLEFGGGLCPGTHAGFPGAGHAKRA